MKLNRIVRYAALVIGLGALATGCAHPQSGALSQDTYPSSTNQAYLTGSYLPQNVNRSGPVTNGRSDVRVLDRSDINRSGGADLNEALRLQGVTP